MPTSKPSGLRSTTNAESSADSYAAFDHRRELRQPRCCPVPQLVTAGSLISLGLQTAVSRLRPTRDAESEMPLAPVNSQVRLAISQVLSMVASAPREHCKVALMGVRQERTPVIDRRRPSGVVRLHRKSDIWPAASTGKTAGQPKTIGIPSSTIARSSPSIADCARRTGEQSARHFPIVVF